MDKPPEQGAKIIDLFSKRERPPKPLGAMGAKVVEFSSIRSSGSDEAPDILPDHIQDAQIIEIPDMPSEIRQEVSELINDAIVVFACRPASGQVIAVPSRVGYLVHLVEGELGMPTQIGRASCRERV